MITNFLRNLGAGLSTPFILCISTTMSLYLGNQEDLGHQLHVLFPFWWMFAGAALLGIALLTFEQFTKHRLVVFFSWAFLLLGPLFLFYSTLQDRIPAVGETGMVAGGVLLLWLFGSFLLSRRGGPRDTKLFFAVLALLFLVMEGWKFHAGVESQTSTFEIAPLKQQTKVVTKKRPNVYHILFDAFESDLFAQTLTRETREKLAEFRFFPDASTPFAITRMAVASIFSGVPYDYATPQIDFQRNAFESEQSFLFALEKEGYENLAIVHPVYAFEQSLLHQVIPLKKYAGAQFVQDNWVLFRNLWLYTYLPKNVAGLIVPEKDMEQMEKRNLLPDVAPIYSYAAFQKFLREEEGMASHNRYTFMHLILPHLPNVLRADGSYGPPLANGDMPETSIQEQVQCATNMILALVERLKELDRFTDSLIIIQADHGSGFWMSAKDMAHPDGGHSLKWHKARSRPLLLLKLAYGQDRGKAFQSLDKEVTLLDIAPTLLDSLRIPVAENRYSGLSLARNDIPQTRGKRAYHFFKKKGWHGWTDVLEKYSIENGTLQREADITLTNNPPILQEDFYKKKIAERKPTQPAEGAIPIVVYNQQNGFKGIRAVHQAEVTLLPEGLLQIQTNGPNPQLFFRTQDLPPGRKPLVKIELTSTVDSLLQVYYKPLGQKKFSEDFSLRQRITQGKNEIWAPIDTSDIQGQWRLDPCKVPGTVTLHSLEIWADIL